MELISNNSVNRLKDILINTWLKNPINISIPSMQLIVEIDGVSAAEPSDLFDNMEQVYFMKNNDTKVMKIKDRSYEMFYNLGEWGYDTRIPESHLCLGTTPLKFGTDYFSQIELSQALEDNNGIYILKNLTKLAGEGAIIRINSRLGTDRAAKERRRTKLVNILGKKTISYDNSDWICITEINKVDLNDEDKADDIFFDLMDSFIKYSLTIEQIIYEENIQQ